MNTIEEFRQLLNKITINEYADGNKLYKKYKDEKLVRYILKLSKFKSEESRKNILSQWEKYKELPADKIKILKGLLKNFPE